MAGINQDFCRRLRAGEFLKGTFAKISDPMVIEMLSAFDLDFVVIDAEHAPLGRYEINNLLIAATAAGLPAIVRIPDKSRYWISSALDCGAAGIMVPHVSTPTDAKQLAGMMSFGKGGRGFSPSTRAADYGARGIAGHLERQRDETVLVCQIEDSEGVRNACNIASVPGVDCLFVGPVDLAVSIGRTSVADSEVQDLCTNVIAGARDASIAAGMFVPDLSGARSWRDRNVSVAVIGTDQAFLRQGAAGSLLETE
jgi:2-keto-3-deoxy-L-rhamnonate aldolase RhmA